MRERFLRLDKDLTFFCINGGSLDRSALTEERGRTLHRIGKKKVRRS